MTAPDPPSDGGRRPDGEGVIRAEFDWSSTGPSDAVVRAIAAASNREPTALEPLYGAVDPDALDALLLSDGTGSEDAEVTVSFTLAGHDVMVHSDGTVVVRQVTRGPK